MLWQIDRIDQAFIQAFEGAGEPDQTVIDAFIEQHPRRIAPTKHVGVKRWYYLHRENPRIRLATLGRPLPDWAGAAKVTVGTTDIIGEFKGNRHLVGQRGLFLQMQPLEWLEGSADRRFATGTEALGSISEQILDARAIERSQQAIQARYEFQRPGIRRSQRGQQSHRPRTQK